MKKLIAHLFVAVLVLSPVWHGVKWTGHEAKAGVHKVLHPHLHAKAKGKK